MIESEEKLDIQMADSLKNSLNSRINSVILRAEHNQLYVGVRLYYQSINMNPPNNMMDIIRECHRCQRALERATYLVRVKAVEIDYEYLLYNP